MISSGTSRRLSLSTNWCNSRIQSGEEIADKALELGFGELELGYRTTEFQVRGFKSRLDKIPVGSVHAFCPVPISAPCGYPELYSLASFDQTERRMAKIHVLRNVEFASEMGARALVLHAGRLPRQSFLGIGRAFFRRRNAKKMLELFRRELDSIVPFLESAGVVLALENLPYFEGFPGYAELKALLDVFEGSPVKGWFDTGHEAIRRRRGWEYIDFEAAAGMFAGMHINDIVDGDDHLPPGEGTVDFAGLSAIARAVEHIVFEPDPRVSEESLLKGVEFIKKTWMI